MEGARLVVIEVAKAEERQVFQETGGYHRHWVLEHVLSKHPCVVRMKRYLCRSHLRTRSLLHRHPLQPMVVDHWTGSEGVLGQRLLLTNGSNPQEVGEGVDETRKVVAVVQPNRG